MEILSNKPSISFDTEKILEPLNKLIPTYNKFFIIGDIFTSEIGGKTRLNRQLFNENNELIQFYISEINFVLEDFLVLLRKEIRNILAKYGEYEKSELINLIFDDRNFIEILEMNLDSKGITGETKQKCIYDIKILLGLKNKIFNLRHFIDMFDTNIFDKYLDRLGVEDLINSTIIFEVIDSYALQYEELLKFEYEVRHFDEASGKINNLNTLNYLVELHKRRVDNFTYANVRYKIYIDYDINVNFPKPIYLNKSYLENILSCFIEQSCMDVVKKELKKGKIQKQIDVNININKGVFQMIVKNNGFEVKNIYNLFISDIDNKYVLEAKNLADKINAKLDIQNLDNEGMQYTLTKKLK